MPNSEVRITWIDQYGLYDASAIFWIQHLTFEQVITLFSEGKVVQLPHSPNPTTFYLAPIGNR